MLLSQGHLWQGKRRTNTKRSLLLSTRPLAPAISGGVPTPACRFPHLRSPSAKFVPNWSHVWGSTDTPRFIFCAVAYLDPDARLARRLSSHRVKEADGTHFIPVPFATSVAGFPVVNSILSPETSTLGANSIPLTRTPSPVVLGSVPPYIPPNHNWSPVRCSLRIVEKVYDSCCAGDPRSGLQLRFSSLCSRSVFPSPRRYRHNTFGRNLSSTCLPPSALGTHPSRLYCPNIVRKPYNGWRRIDSTPSPGRRSLTRHYQCFDGPVWTNNVGSY